MNRYGQLALDHSRTHRPVAYSQIPHPNRFFTEAGEQIATQVTRLRDEILGPARPSESPEDYRRRSCQALATAEELTLADHHLFQVEPTETVEDWEDDPDLGRRYESLAMINEAIHRPL